MQWYNRYVSVVIILSIMLLHAVHSEIARYDNRSVLTSNVLQTELKRHITMTILK